jgi:transaldolase
VPRGNSPPPNPPPLTHPPPPPRLCPPAGTVIVADTGDLEKIAALRPQDATTNPSLILAAAKLPATAEIIDAAVAAAAAEVGPDADERAALDAAIDHVSVAVGTKIASLVPGYVSTEVDARLSFDTDATVARGRRLVAL